MAPLGVKSLKTARTVSAPRRGLRWPAAPPNRMVLEEFSCCNAETRGVAQTPAPGSTWWSRPIFECFFTQNRPFFTQNDSFSGHSAGYWRQWAIRLLLEGSPDIAER